MYCCEQQTAVYLPNLLSSWGGTVFMWPALMGIAWLTTSNITSTSFGIGSNALRSDGGNGSPSSRSMPPIGISGSKVWIFQTFDYMKNF